MKLAYYHLSGT